MSIAEIPIKSLGQFIDLVTPAEPDRDTGRWRESGVYRGAADARWALLTSLDRLGGVDPPHTKAKLEEHLFRNFQRYSRPHLTVTPADEWELLITAEHYGLPTRLLDWTYSPLIAAHFATLKILPGADPAIWRFDWRRVHRHFGFPELAFMVQDLLSLFSKSGRFTPWVLFKAKPSARPFACMLEPPSLDLRIVSQSATFTLCSDTSRSFDDFLREHGLSDALTKFIIPAGEVPRVRDQLDLVGIDERRLFPDLDGVAAELRRYYA